MMIVLAGMVFAIAGAVAGMLGSYMVMGVLGVSDFEGMRAMTAFVLFAPLGAIVGLALGVPLTLRFGAGRTVPPVLATLLVGAAVLALSSPRSRTRCQRRWGLNRRQRRWAGFVPTHRPKTG
jgi:hypothetical protein